MTFGRAANTAVLLGWAAWASAQEPPRPAPTPTPTPAPAPAATPQPAATPKPRPRPTPTPGPPDVYHLRDGDRITGRTVGRSTRAFVVHTAYGRVNIPRGRVVRILRGDGTEEVFDVPEAVAAPAPAPTPPPAPAATARLALAISGKTFWQAWDPKKERDPTLRLELRLDEEAIAFFADQELDPDQIKGAAVNSFSFTGNVASTPAPQVLVHPPEVRPGRIVLKLDVPVTGSAARRLRIAYQMNEGTAEDPAWKDLVSATTEIQLSPSQPAVIEVRQDRGRMEFSGFPRRKMKNVETFKLDLSAGAAADGAP